MNEHRPHTLDEVIGNQPRPAEEISADLAKSPAFLAAIGRAVAETAQGEGNNGFAVRVRRALGRELLEGRTEE